MTCVAGNASRVGVRGIPTLVLSLQFLCRRPINPYYSKPRTFLDPPWDKTDAFASETHAKKKKKIASI